ERSNSRPAWRLCIRSLRAGFILPLWMTRPDRNGPRSTDGAHIDKLVDVPARLGVRNAPIWANALSRRGPWGSGSRGPFQPPAHLRARDDAGALEHRLPVPKYDELRD